MISAESFQSKVQSLKYFFFFCIVRLDSLAIDHHWAPLSASATADNYSSSSLLEGLPMWTGAQTLSDCWVGGREVGGGGEKTKKSHTETTAV